MRYNELEMDRRLFNATFSAPTALLFIVDDCFVSNNATIVEGSLTFTSTNAPSLRFSRQTRVGSKNFSGVPIKTERTSLRYTRAMPSMIRGHDDALNKQESPRSDISLYQAWRSPSWSHCLPTRGTTIESPKTEALAYLTAVVDGALRIACVVLVLIGLGRLHSFYGTFHRIAGTHVGTASERLQAHISMGRIVRCNPISGIRVKNVSLSKSTKDGRVQYSRASHVHASFSGYAGLLLHKRPLQLSIGVNRGAFTVICPDSAEFYRGRMPMPNLDDQFRLIADGYRIFPVRTATNNATLFELRSIVMTNSRAHIECVRQNLTGNAVHSADIFNISARFDPIRSTKGVSTAQIEAPNQSTLTLEGNFAGGGYAHVRLAVRRNEEELANSNSFSLSARTKCSKVNIGTIAPFISLPFGLTDGVCSGSVNVELSPSASLIPSMHGQVEVRSLGVRFDPSVEAPELRKVTGKLRFQQKSVVLDGIEGNLGTIPLEATGHIDFIEGFNIESHAKPFDVNKIIETFSVKGFIPVEGSVIGKAIVRGHLDEPFVSGWVKAVGNRAVADRVPLKSAIMTYDWDASAGNLLFPKIQGIVLGGGEITGSGGIYFDMTQITPGGYWKEEHHIRNPKAKFGNPNAGAAQSLPRPPTDDFEIDKWAPYRPYDSMDFTLTCFDVHGENLFDWYGQKPSRFTMDPMNRIGGHCRIAGHAEDANSQIVWRSTRLRDPRNLKIENLSSTLVLEESGFGSESEHTSSQEAPHLVEESRIGSSVNHFRNDTPSERAWSSRQGDSGFVGGLILVKLGDLPEARRVKARTTIKRLDVKQFASHSSSLKNFLPLSPNVSVSMDTLFKGTICMRPSWDSHQAEGSRRNSHLDLVGIDGGLAVRDLALNGITFENIMCGSLSFSPRDVSLRLMESHSQSTSPQFEAEYSRTVSKPEYDFDVLNVELNAKGVLDLHFKWNSSEICASMHMNEQKHRIAQLRARNVSLHELSGEYNPLLKDESAKGVLTTSCELDFTSQVGSMDMSVSDLHLGHVHLELVNSKFSYKNGEVCMKGEILDENISGLTLDGRFAGRKEFSDCEWLLNVNIDYVQVHFLSLMVQDVVSALTPQSGGFFSKDGIDSNDELQIGRSGINYSARSSNMTYWEIPEGLSLMEEIKWFNESGKDARGDLSAFFKPESARSAVPSGMAVSSPNLSGRLSIQYSPQINRAKQKSSISTSPWGSLAALANLSLSFDLNGEKWNVGMSTIERVTVRGYIEDGSLTLEHAGVIGDDGLLIECKGSITGPGFADGSLNLHHVPVSSVSYFQKLGLLVDGNVDGKFKVQGNISNPNVFGQMVWSNATINGRYVSHPKATLSCSKGRCIMNMDAAVEVSRNNRRESSGVQNIFPTGAEGETSRDENTTMRNEEVAARRMSKQGPDTMTARVSIPVRLVIHQYVLPKLSEALFGKNLAPTHDQPHFDDDWVFASVEIRRYGIAFLSAFMPELGWRRGNSDVIFRVAGTQRNPQIAGYVKLKGASIHPIWTAHPINSINGEIEVGKFGLLACKHLSGRCHGRGVSLRGGMFISKRHRDLLETEVKGLQNIVSSTGDSSKRRDRELHASLNEKLSALRKDRDGIHVDIRGIPTRFRDACEGTISGKVLITGTALSPEVDGSLLFSDGIIKAGNGFGGGAQSVMGSSELLSRRQPSVEKPSVELPKQKVKTEEETNAIAEEDDAGNLCKVHVRKLTVTLGRNVSIVHPFLFNVVAGGNVSVSGPGTSPAFHGKINILSGSIGTLPARWGVRKSESSYVTFAHNPAQQSQQEPTVKLVVENDSFILRVAECAVSTWMDNLSMSHRAGNRVSEKWWGDTIEMSGVENRSAQTIVNVIAGLMKSALVVSRETGSYSWRVFPTHFEDASEDVSRKPREKYGAGLSLEKGRCSFESNFFLDKLKGVKLTLKLAGLRLNVFSDQVRRIANLELEFPGR